MFDLAYEILLQNEGGYSNHPDDAGGATKFGISKARYPHIDIEKITLAQAKDITRRDFWKAYRCEEFPFPIALVLFDCVFNHHPRNPIMWLQKAVGVKADGLIGTQTIAAANQAEDHLHVARDMLAQRTIYYSQHPKWETFRAGWIKRVLDTMIGATCG